VAVSGAANSVPRPWPWMKKLHSSLDGCQWISRRAPGFTVTRAAEKLEAMGKVNGSTILTLPPGTSCAGCSEKWYE